MDDAEIVWSDVDLLIDCSTTRIRPIPCNAAHHLASFGEHTRGIACFDIQSTCLGFLVALNTANALIGTGAYRHIILVASECAMQAINWSQPESAALIGDGAAAVVLEPASSLGNLVMMHQSYTEYLDLCKVDGGAHKLPPSEYTPERRAEYSFDMNGPAVFRLALSKLPTMARAAISEWLAMPELSNLVDELHTIPHQASPRALASIRTLLGISEERFHTSVRETGNVAAASIPFTLDWCLKSARMPSRSPCMLLGTSAGYAQGVLIFTVGRP
jgi:3-oxoacyl-[acyl-carrier-protein] synthase-3